MTTIEIFEGWKVTHLPCQQTGEYHVVNPAGRVVHSGSDVDAVRRRMRYLANNGDLLRCHISDVRGLAKNLDAADAYLVSDRQALRAVADAAAKLLCLEVLP